MLDKRYIWTGLGLVLPVDIVLALHFLMGYYRQFDAGMKFWISGLIVLSVISYFVFISVVAGYVSMVCRILIKGYVSSKSFNKNPFKVSSFQRDLTVGVIVVILVVVLLGIISSGLFENLSYLYH